MQGISICIIKKYALSLSSKICRRNLNVHYFVSAAIQAVPTYLQALYLNFK